MFLNPWQKLTIFWGIFGSILYSLILSNISLIDRLELYVYDGLARRISSKKVNSEIIILKLKEEELREQGLLNESDFYSNLVKQIIENRASIVILNLLPHWVNNYEYEEINEPLKSLVTDYHKKIVIVSPTHQVKEQQKPEIQIYYKFLPFDSTGYPEILPEEIFGFFEYELEAENPRAINSSARQFYTKAEFLLSDNRQDANFFQSFAVLALNKYNQVINFKNKSHNYPDKLNLKFLHKQINFPTFTWQEFNNLSPNYLDNKIVLVGFAGTDKPHNMVVQTPWGNLINSVELQANILGNLLNREFYQTIPYFVNVFLITVGSVFISIIITSSEIKKKYIYLFLIAFFISVYILSIIFVAYFKLIFLLILPISTWLLTSISLQITLILLRQQNLIEQQQNELNRLQAIERKAIISYAKKLLHRVASNIHDGPLQELKMIMDDLELLEMEQENEKINLILDKLETMGKNIRIYLDNTRNLSFEISSELRQGLNRGIKNKINELKQNQELTLKVICHLDKIKEPELNSIWLESREDIFRFFCEAINNVIQHTQFPYGNASYLEVNLFQKQDRVILEIINDGCNSINNPNIRAKGGYGTKLMSTIASELPQGNWIREVNNNINYVKLTWDMDYYNKHQS